MAPKTLAGCLPRAASAFRDRACVFEASQPGGPWVSWGRTLAPPTWKSTVTSRPVSARTRKRIFRSARWSRRTGVIRERLSAGDGAPWSLLHTGLPQALGVDFLPF